MDWRKEKENQLLKIWHNNYAIDIEFFLPQYALQKRKHAYEKYHPKYDPSGRMKIF